MDNGLIIGIIGAVASILSFGFAVKQTIRIQRFQKMNDTHINLIWKNAKELSHLILRQEATHSRKVCGDKSQDLEKLICSFVINNFDLNEDDIKNWYGNKTIDDFDRPVLLSLIKSTKHNRSYKQ